MWSASTCNWLYMHNSFDWFSLSNFLSLFKAQNSQDFLRPSVWYSPAGPTWTVFMGTQRGNAKTTTFISGMTQRQGILKHIKPQNSLSLTSIYFCYFAMYLSSFSREIWQFFKLNEMTKLTWVRICILNIQCMYYI